MNYNRWAPITSAASAWGDRWRSKLPSNWPGTARVWRCWRFSTAIITTAPFPGDRSQTGLSIVFKNLSSTSGTCCNSLRSTGRCIWQTNLRVPGRESWPGCPWRCPIFAGGFAPGARVRVLKRRRRLPTCRGASAARTGAPSPGRTAGRLRSQALRRRCGTLRRGSRVYGRRRCCRRDA